MTGKEIHLKVVLLKLITEYLGYISRKANNALIELSLAFEYKVIDGYISVASETLLC